MRSRVFVEVLAFTRNLGRSFPHRKEVSLVGIHADIWVEVVVRVLEVYDCFYFLSEVEIRIIR